MITVQGSEEYCKVVLMLISIVHRAIYRMHLDMYSTQRKGIFATIQTRKPKQTSSCLLSFSLQSRVFLAVHGVPVIIPPLAAGPFKITSVPERPEHLVPLLEELQTEALSDMPS